MPDVPSTLLPLPFRRWFEGRGWTPRPHQLDALAAGLAGESFLLIAPTGGGKTLSGLLPSLVDLAAGAAGRGLHTLYVSPLKALSVDVARNLGAPVAEMGLPVRLETRTGDTPAHKRQRQKYDPPDILLTTPEQIALLLSHKDSATLFGGVKAIIIDELHAMAGGKRGHLLALGLSRLKRLAPEARMVGLSATVPHPEALIAWLAGGDAEHRPPPRLIRAAGGARADVDILQSKARIPWAGHSARHAWAEVYDAIRSARTTLVFVNTRSQAEMTFQALWRLNEDNLPIALHHGSLDVERRRKVEAAMAKGALRAVVCTSTLDLGIDWGEVDLVIQIGAPKGASRITQRIGRANHRMDEPSRALLVPGNRFEVLECIAARDAVSEGALDGEPPRAGALDVLAQHILGLACAGPVRKEDLYTEVTSTAPYAALDRAVFDKVFGFVENGGYAMKSYDRWRRLVATPDGAYRVRSPAVAQAYRLNVGTIIESPAMRVRLARGRGARGGRILGTLEEWYAEGLAIGDTFLFAGEVLRFEGAEGTDILVTRAAGEDPKTPMWGGGKFPLSTYLAERVRKMVASPAAWDGLPEPIREWLELQHAVSVLPGRDELLVETFPHQNRHFLVAYPFDGRLAHQTLGMLLTRRLERAGLQPIGFVAGEYALSIWARKDLSGVAMNALFDEDMLGDDLESWLAESILMKRTFRDCAVIAGLIERRFPGERKSGRQVTFSADLIFNVLKAHEPDHILLKAAWEDAAGGYLDLARLQNLLARVRGRVNHQALDRVSPLAVPVMLEIGRNPVEGEAREAALSEAALDGEAGLLDEAALIAEAMDGAREGGRNRGARGGTGDPRQRRMPKTAQRRRAPLA